MKQNSMKTIFVRLEDLNEKINYNEINLKLASKLLKQLSEKNTSEKDTNKK